MNVLLVASGASTHTVRWVNALSNAGARVTLATQHEPDPSIHSTVNVRRLPYSGWRGYFFNAFALRRIVEELKPELLHTHYASGYGTTARLVGFKPTLLSVWGSDIFEFPEKSSVHRWWLRGNLLSASEVASTSRAMALRTQFIAPELRRIAITPFGVDSKVFRPDPRKSCRSERRIVIGTVKGLADVYGVDRLVESFVILRGLIGRDQPELAHALRLRIVGDGPQKETIERQVAEHGIAGITQLLPRIPHDNVPSALCELDVYVALSRQESFGVTVIEAGACALPVVVSDAGGLPEVVADGETGFVIPKGDPQAAAEALRKLVLSKELRRQMGQAGRRRVVSLYDWHDNVKHMIALYEKVIAESEGNENR